MGGELQRWNPNDFKDKVEQRIKEAFIELIPEEAFTKMVSEAIDNFTTGRVLTRSARDGGTEEQYWPSGLERTIEEMLKTEVRQALRIMLNDEKWQKTWEGKVGEELAKVVAKATPAIIQTWVTELVNGIVERARQGY